MGIDWRAISGAVWALTGELPVGLFFHLLETYQWGCVGIDWRAISGAVWALTGELLVELF